MAKIPFRIRNYEEVVAQLPLFVGSGDLIMVSRWWLLVVAVK